MVIKQILSHRDLHNSADIQHIDIVLTFISYVSHHYFISGDFVYFLHPIPPSFRPLNESALCATHCAQPGQTSHTFALSLLDCHGCHRHVCLLFFVVVVVVFLLSGMVPTLSAAVCLPSPRAWALARRRKPLGGSFAWHQYPVPDERPRTRSSRWNNYISLPFISFFPFVSSILPCFSSPPPLCLCVYLGLPNGPAWCLIRHASYQLGQE